MQTVWNGLGLLPNNMVWSDAFLQYSVWVVLDPIPGVPKTVRLPVHTHCVQLYLPEGNCWYALDHAPGPIMPPLQGSIVDDDYFVPGGVVFGGQWHALAIAETEQMHEVQLISATPGLPVLLTVLKEGLAY